MRNCNSSVNCTPPYHTPDNTHSHASECSCYLAIANVPWQSFTHSYEPERALQVGTLFPELDKPFLGRSVSS